MYNNGNGENIYYDNVEGKKAKLNADGMIVVNINNFSETENNWQIYIAGLSTKIKETEYKGKKCYSIKNYGEVGFPSNTDKDEVYIEKDTGLITKLIMDEIITEKEYEFNQVDDQVFEEPDISQYELIENNV